MEFARDHWLRGAPAKLLIALVSFSSPVLSGPDGHAQQRSEPLLSAPGVLEVFQGSDAPFPIKIDQSTLASKEGLILIQGLPVTCVLSAGRLFDSGTWALRMSDLPDLRIKLAPAAKGDSTLSISLVTIEGKVLAERRVSLLVQPQNLSTALSPEVTGAQTLAVPPTASNEHAVEPLEAPQVLMARGDANVGEGKIHVARLFYRRAAERGWADAAVAMGSTYDPYELPRMKVIGGVQASPDLARQWYEKARALGANVDERLQRLGGR